jgi:enamine deaminase RidA (YjgF/YER057c/UK114 family)
MAVTPDGIPAPALPYSQAVRAGDFVFTAGQMATDYATGVVPEARPDPALPNHGSSTYLQAEYVFGNLGRVLEAAGSSSTDVIHLEVFYRARHPVRQALAARNRHMAGAVPCGTNVVAGLPVVPEAWFTLEAIAAVSRPDGGPSPIRPEGWPAPDHGYAVGITTGDYVWTGGAAASDVTTSDAIYFGELGTAVAREARVDPNYWYGSEIESQTRFALKKLRLFLETAGTSFEHVVKAVVFLMHPGDYWGFEQVWKEHFPTDPPALTITPMEGYGPVGCIVEIRLVALRPDGAVRKEIIETDRAPRPLGHASQAVRAGNLLFLSGQMPVDERGLDPAAAIPDGLPYFWSRGTRQMEVVLENTQALCEAGGTSLENMARGQLYFWDGRDVAPAFDLWRKAFPADPPAATILLPEGDPLIPGSGLTADWIAYVPG